MPSGEQLISIRLLNVNFVLILPVEDCHCKPCNQARVAKHLREEREAAKAAQQSRGSNLIQAAVTTLSIAQAVTVTNIGDFQPGAKRYVRPKLG